MAIGLTWLDFNDLVTLLKSFRYILDNLGPDRLSETYTLDDLLKYLMVWLIRLEGANFPTA